MEMIVVKNLCKIFGENKKSNKKAVDDLSFAVNKGEVFALLGENGAGKTTTIRMLTLQLKPTSGSVEYDGKNIFDESESLKSIIGVVPQHINFDQELSVRENLELVGRLYHIEAKTRLNRINELLNFAELTERANDNVRKLSGGMKRRLLIARALIHKPKILFMDEPTVALDPEARRRIWELIKNLSKKGVTVFLTTHYIEEAENLCNRVAFLNKGKLIALDTPENFKIKLGKFVVEWDDGRKREFFNTHGEAASFRKNLNENENSRLRQSNLEDVFLTFSDEKRGNSLANGL